MLASNESPIVQTVSDTNTVIPSTRTTNTGSSKAPQPKNSPVIPQIPAVSQLPDLTQADGSERPVAATGIAHRPRKLHRLRRSWRQNR